MENSKDFDVNFIDISLDDLRDIDLLEASIFDEIARKNVLSENEESEIEDYNIYPPKNRKRKRMVIPSESESEIDDVEKIVNENIDRLSASTSQKWLQPKGHQPSVIAFTELTGIILYYFIVCFVLFFVCSTLDYR